MKGLPEEAIYVLMFAFILLLQYLIKRFGPQPPQSTAPAQEQEEESVAVEAPAQTIDAGRFGRGTAPIARRRYSRRALMGTRRDVQNAVVIATILGPCRAFEPHESR